MHRRIIPLPFPPHRPHPFLRHSPPFLKHLSPPPPSSPAPFKSISTGAPPSSAAPAHPSPLESLSPHQMGQVSLYRRSLLDWNQRMNLTSVTGEGEVMERHVLDSLAIVPPLQRAYLSRCTNSATMEGIEVVDVGSGAGLPGLILAIAYPSWKVTLLESMQKRCVFLEHVVGQIGLSNVQILCKRAENS